MHGDGFGRGFGIQKGNDVIHGFRKENIFEAKNHLPEFNPGQGHQVFHQAMEPPGLFEHDVGEPLRVLGVLQGAGLKRFQIADDGRKRRADFMRDIGHKVRPDALQFFKPGHVMEDDHDFFFPGKPLNFGQANAHDHRFGDAQRNFARNTLPGLLKTLKRLLKFGVAERFQKRLAQKVFVLAGKNAGQRRAQKFDLFIVVQDHHAFVDAGQRGHQLAFFFLGQPDLVLELLHQIVDVIRQRPGFIGRPDHDGADGLPLAQPLRKFLHRPDGGGQPVGKKQGGDQRHQRADQHGQEDGPINLFNRALDIVKRTSQSDIAADFRPVFEDHSHVKHVHAQRVAVSDGFTDTLQSGFLNFRTKQVVFQSGDRLL